MRLVTGMAVLGFGLLGVAAPVAGAEPVIPVDPVAPAPAVVTQASAPASITPADGVSHLPSPDSLPPGTTQTAPEHPTLDYLKDVWKALRTEEVTASDALLLLAQRPVNDTRVADSVPQGQSVPAVPAPPAAPAAEASAPASPPPAG